jgi:acyl-coenzyme A synthetase/AMP-(fatty) acid ligase
MQKTITFNGAVNDESIGAGHARASVISDIRHVLLSHEAVMEAIVADEQSESGRSLFKATVCLKKGYPPSNELKNELAWTVAADLGPDVVFKNIEFEKSVPKPQEKTAEVKDDGSVVHISGHRISISEVRAALEGHEEVAGARVEGMKDGRKGEVLLASVALREDITPCNDLKTQLAWHVQATVSPFVVFKDIEFGEAKDESKGYAKEGESMVIVDGVGDEGMSMHISSHRISTTEVTMTLLKHPDVADAAVVNVPDEGVGEKMKAFVKLKEGVAPSNDLKLELAWFVMSELKPIAVFKSVDLETPRPDAEASHSRESVLKERVMISGHTVLSDGVEKALERHESVAEAIVIGVPDEKHGEALKAFVTLENGIAPTEDLRTELSWHARTEIGPDVVFKSIDFKRFLPKSEDKDALKSILWAAAMNIPTKISITVAD